MRPEILYPLFSDLKYIKGVGPALSNRFKSLCGTRVWDLLSLRPSAIIDRTNRPAITMTEEGEIATFEVVVESHQAGYGRKSPYKVLCRNDTGFLTLLYFGGRKDYLEKQLPIGETVIVSGKVELYGEGRQMPHPDFAVKLSEQDKILKYEPQYPLTAGITQKKVQSILALALEKLPNLPEWNEKAEVTFKQAMLEIHKPEEGEINPTALSRLAYDELLASQLAQGLVHKQVTKKKGVKIQLQGDLSKQFLSNLPFDLTNGQKEVMGEIFDDMQSGHRMFRLLQGDVGCGKTAVGLGAIIPVIESGHQAAFMMPTTLLSYQQKAWIESVTEGMGLTIEVLTSAEKGKKREEILSRVKSGEADILIGTHALFQDWVDFKSLGLIIIDEQHRFGVLQRLKLSQKNEQAHILLMTATPIPRTMTIAFFGEMNISRITEKPKNRIPIETLAMPISKLEQITESMNRALSKGEKIFWICPLVEESEKIDLAAATDRYEHFKNILGDKVGLVHGQMKEAEKEAALKKFIDGEFQLLIATTVIEVGIDVSDATIIFIEHAERFGLSQLHQLRGRVGRGDKKSTCILLYSGNISGNSEARLKIMKDTNDGFIIAEEDLKLRGGGDMLGTRQSGFAAFKFTIMSEHKELLFEARKKAKEILKEDPKLTGKNGANLRLLLTLFEYDETMEYISAG